MDKLKTLGALLLGAALHVAPVSAQTSAPAPAKLVPAQSEVMFVTKQMGVPVDGRFKKFDAQIHLDPRKPEGGSVAVSIDTGSAALGVPESDAELPKAVWFNVAKFPQAIFKSTAIKGLGNGRFEVAGKLDIKGSVRDVVVPVQITQAGGASTATGSFIVKRLDFKIGEAEWTDTTVVANDVMVKFKLALTGLGAL
jgi:polyisoprenoid-binding protein YceI